MGPFTGYHCQFPYRKHQHYSQQCHNQYKRQFASVNSNLPNRLESRFFCGNQGKIAEFHRSGCFEIEGVLSKVGSALRVYKAHPIRPFIDILNKGTADQPVVAYGVESGFLFVHVVVRRLAVTVEHHLLDFAAYRETASDDSQFITVQLILLDSYSGDIGYRNILIQPEIDRFCRPAVAYLVDWSHSQGPHTVIDIVEVELGGSGAYSGGRRTNSKIGQVPLIGGSAEILQAVGISGYILALGRLPGDSPGIRF